MNAEELDNPISAQEIVCPKCGHIHKNSEEYIPKECGDGDEYYISCENCKKPLIVDVNFDYEYLEKNPFTTFQECLKANEVFYNTYCNEN